LVDAVESEIATSLALLAMTVKSALLVMTGRLALLEVTGIVIASEVPGKAVIAKRGLIQSLRAKRGNLRSPRR